MPSTGYLVSREKIGGQVIRYPGGCVKVCILRHLMEILSTYVRKIGELPEFVFGLLLFHIFVYYAISSRLILVSYLFKLQLK